MKTHYARVRQVACFYPLVVLFLFFVSGPLSAQKVDHGAIKVVMTDSAINDVIPFANVILYDSAHKQITTATTSMEGVTYFKKLKPGRYAVKGVYVAYHAKEIKDIQVGEGKTSYVSLSLSNAGVVLQEVNCVTYMQPGIDPDTKSGQTVTTEDYTIIPRRSKGEKGLNVRGGRESEQTYYVDGVKVYGTPQMPQQSSEQLAILLGGVPASQGDEPLEMAGEAVKTVGVQPADQYPLLSPEDNTIYPFAGEGYEEAVENNFKVCTRDPLSTFSSDVDVASYANIRRMLVQGYLPPKEAVRIEEMINYFRYKYPEPKEDEAFGIHHEISTCPWNKDHRLLQVGIQARTVELKESVPNNLTFLVDVSGSMDSPDKLPLLKDALTMLVKQMREKDRVAIVVYAGNAGLVLPPTPGNRIAEILKAIRHLEAGGSTAGGEGIVLAYKVAREQYAANTNNRVILATDGDFNVGVSDDASLVKLIEEKRDQGVFLSVLGFGTGNYQDAKMEKLADKGNGNYAYIDNLLEAKKVLVKEMNGTLVTVAKDVKIQLEFNPKYVRSYRLIGYDNRMLEHEDFEDDKKDAGDVGSGHSVTALYEIVPADAPGKEPVARGYKYQKNEMTGAAMSNEVCTIKLRYKEPVEKQSKEVVELVSDVNTAFENTSDNFRFCSAVAEFGLILRQSRYKEKSNYQEVARIAKAAKGDDDENYRSEFIRLCEMADALASR